MVPELASFLPVVSMRCGVMQCVMVDTCLTSVQLTTVTTVCVKVAVPLASNYNLLLPFADI